MIRQLYNLIAVNFKEFFREPGIIFWALAFPLLLSGVLGLAFSQSERPPIAAAVVASADSPEFRALAARLKKPAGAGPFEEEFRLIAGDAASARLALKRGQATLILYREAGAWRARFDPANDGARSAWRALDQRLSGRAPTAAPQALESRGDRYIDFLIPGLLALGVMNSCMWGIGYALIDIRSKKLLRRMAASPMSKTAFMLSHFIARLSFIALESLLLFVFARFVFDVEFQGSPLALILLLASGAAAFSGIAILCASRAQSLQAANGVVNAVTLPMTIVSGIFFSYQSFPDWIVSVLQYLPLTLLADAVRACFNEGAGLAAAAPAIAALFAVGALTFLPGLKLFRWR